MAINQEVETDIVAERDEARRIADAALRQVAHESEGEVRLLDPRNESTGMAALTWLAAETRAARLDRACEVG